MRQLGCGMLVLLGLVVFFFLGLLGGLALLEPPFQLLFGWIASLWRYVHAWHARPATIAWVGLGMLLLVAGTQRFAQWLFSSHLQTEAQTKPPRWRWKWTLSGYGLLACALLAIASVVLTIHQVYWLSQSTEPWFENKTRRAGLLLATAYRLQHQAEQNNWDWGSTRAAFWTNSTSEGMEWEQLEPIWVPKDETTLRAIILVQRQKGSYRRGFAVIESGRTVITRRMEDLEDTLVSFDIHTGAPSPLQRQP